MAPVLVMCERLQDRRDYLFLGSNGGGLEALAPASYFLLAVDTQGMLYNHQLIKQ
jgi:hypothetical protein